jgi:cephalosporin hydroxylase
MPRFAGAAAAGICSPSMPDRPPPPPDPGATIAPEVRDPEYSRKYAMTLAKWMLYHQDNIVFDKVHWMGVRALKNPLDCWIYQEIVWETKPEVLIEIGSLHGGGTMFFCHLFDIIGGGAVLSVDVDRSDYHAKHPRLTDITGDCADPAVAARAAAFCAGKRTMVIHDADHNKDAVLAALRLYSGLVTVGNYFIVEDGHVDVFDPSVRLGWDRPGPLAAVREFLAGDDRFVMDPERERYLITYNPGGFLKRVK